MSTPTEASPETHPRPRKRRHPGSGRGEARHRPKGRQVDPQALDEVRALLGERPRDRDLLIEHLHLIQDAHRCISAPHLAALAHEMRLPMAEVYEVATFYAHFDVLAEGAVRSVDSSPALPPRSDPRTESWSPSLLFQHELRRVMTP